MHVRRAAGPLRLLLDPGFTFWISAILRPAMFVGNHAPQLPAAVQVRPQLLGLAARPHQGPRRYCVCFCYRPCRTSGRIAYDLNRSHSKRPSVCKYGWADLNLVRVYPALSSHWHVRTYDTWPRVTFIWHTPLSVCRFSIAVYTGQYRVCQHPPRPAAVGRARV